MNAVGWVLCGMGLIVEVHAFAGAYADYTLFAHPGSLPGGKIMLWLTEWLAFPGGTLAFGCLFVAALLHELAIVRGAHSH